MNNPQYFKTRELARKAVKEMVGYKTKVEKIEGLGWVIDCGNNKFLRENGIVN